MDSFAFIVRLLKEYQLLFLIPATFIEGPIVTVIAGSLAATGVLKLWLVFLGTLAGDFGGDLFYYGLGRFGRRELIDRYGSYFRIRPDALLDAERYAAAHSLKSLFIAKISHALGLAILFLLGLFRMNFFRFIGASFLIGIPKTTLLVAVGYFFVRSYEGLGAYFNWGGEAILFLVSLYLMYKVFFFIKGKNHFYG